MRRLSRVKHIITMMTFITSSMLSFSPGSGSLSCILRHRMMTGILLIQVLKPSIALAAALFPACQWKRKLTSLILLYPMRTVTVCQTRMKIWKAPIPMIRTRMMTAWWTDSRWPMDLARVRIFSRILTGKDRKMIRIWTDSTIWVSKPPVQIPPTRTVMAGVSTTGWKSLNSRPTPLTRTMTWSTFPGRFMI